MHELDQRWPVGAGLGCELPTLPFHSLGDAEPDGLFSLGQR